MRDSLTARAKEFNILVERASPSHTQVLRHRRLRSAPRPALRSLLYVSWQVHEVKS